ncbi:hypothetical protein KKC52_13630 [bacterium]|nr:hypothetical protein [bacterium]
MMPKTKEEVKSILVIRSAPLPRTFEVLKKLREEYSNAEISILLQQEVKDEIEKTCLPKPRHRQGALANKVIVGIKRGRISLFRHLPLVLQLRKKLLMADPRSLIPANYFDLVAIIYNTEDISWYSNLRLFASAIRAKERVGITIENTLQPFNTREVIFKDLILRMILRPLILIIITPLLIVLLGVSLSLFYLRNAFMNFKKLFFCTKINLHS